MDIAINLKKLRTEKGLTQDEISKDLGINRATYAHYETGRREPDAQTLKLLAKYFDVSLDYLVGIADIRNPYLNDNSNLKEDPASRLTDEFYDLLIKHGVIKNKEELTPAKAIKILDMIFNEDDNNAKDTED